MPYTYLHIGNRYGLRNKNTGKTIWYDPKKVKSMADLKYMARIREMYSHGFVGSYNRKSKKGKRHSVNHYWRAK